MKLERGQDIKTLLNRHNTLIRLVLIYGQDGGLIHERACDIVTHIAGSKGDPFRVSELNIAQINSVPTRLFEEVAAISMTGGRRVVWVREVSDTGVSKIIGSFLKNLPSNDTLVVLEAGDLPLRSSLRKLSEDSEHALTIACYHDTLSEIERMITSTLNHHRIQITPDNRRYLALRLGNDRLISRKELEKLTLLIPEGGRVTEIDIATITGDNSEISVHDMITALTQGDVQKLTHSITRLIDGGETAITIIRAAMRHLQRMHFVAGAVACGETATAAVASLRPQPFKRDTEMLIAALQRWSLNRLTRALRQMTELEIACKTTGLPEVTILNATLVHLTTCA